MWKHLSVITVESFAIIKKIMNYKIIKQSVESKGCKAIIHTTKYWCHRVCYKITETKSTLPEYGTTKLWNLYPFTRIWSSHLQHKIIKPSSSPQDYDAIKHTTGLWVPHLHHRIMKPIIPIIGIWSHKIMYHRPYHKIVRSSSTLLLCCHYSYHVFMKQSLIPQNYEAIPYIPQW